jgi:hypothetical protein
MEVKTFYDLKYESSSKIFEAEKIDGFEKLTPDQIQEGEKFYNLLIEKLEKNQEIDEGLLKQIGFGVAGALVGPLIMKSICKILGISEGGPLYSLLTSRLVMTSVGIAMGK